MLAETFRDKDLPRKRIPVTPVTLTNDTVAFVPKITMNKGQFRETLDEDSMTRLDHQSKQLSGCLDPEYTCVLITTQPGSEDDWKVPPDGGFEHGITGIYLGHTHLMMRFDDIEDARSTRATKYGTIARGEKVNDGDADDARSFWTDTTDEKGNDWDEAELERVSRSCCSVM